MDGSEDVILLDSAGNPVGTAPKATVHTADTPLHLAFSCHVIGPDGRVLVTRRALGKRTWPGVWTNSFCGHPRPGEALIDAVRRHGTHELGVELTDIKLALPRFAYRAVDASGIVENEVCPVFIARTSSAPELNPDEAAEWQWAESAHLGLAIRSVPWAFSPWFAMQADELDLYTVGV